MDDWLLNILVCPQDHNKLHVEKNTLVCPDGHLYPCVDNIPILLRDDVKKTQELLKQKSINNSSRDQGFVDQFVQEAIAATNGIIWKSQINKLKTYPVPEIPIPKANEQCFLDIGCNWGRWSISAARKGYKVIGIDHNLNAILAAKRVAKQLNISAQFLVADGRYLPFAESTFDYIFSYSVIQHFDKDDAKLCLKEIARTLKLSGKSLIQMPNTIGIRNLFHQLKRGFKRPSNFDVRYWNLNELKTTFTNIIGPTELEADAYFNLNPDIANIKCLPYYYQYTILCSETLRKMSKNIPWMLNIADSVFVSSMRKLSKQN